MIYLLAAVFARDYGCVGIDFMIFSFWVGLKLQVILEFNYFLLSVVNLYDSASGDMTRLTYVATLTPQANKIRSTQSVSISVLLSTAAVYRMKTT